MAVAKALNSTFDNAEYLQATVVNFKVSNTGITLTDTKKKYVSNLIILPHWDFTSNQRKKKIILLTFLNIDYFHGDIFQKNL